MASPSKAVLVPDVSAMAQHGLLSTLLGQWEITLDEGTYIWGRVFVKSLKDAVILTDEVIPCAFTFRQRDNPDLRAVPGVPSVIAVHWGDDFAILESHDKDLLTWRSAPSPDGSLGQHNVWKRIDGISGVDQVTEVTAKAADEPAMVRKQVEDDVSKAWDELAEVRDELAEIRAKLILANDLSEARAQVADEIAEENMTIRKELDAEVAKSASLREQAAALTEALMLMKQSNDGELVSRSQEASESDIEQLPTVPRETFTVDLTSPEEASIPEASTPEASTPVRLETTPEDKLRKGKRARKEARAAYEEVHQERPKKRRANAGACKRQSAGMDIRAALVAGGA